MKWIKHWMVHYGISSIINILTSSKMCGNRHAAHQLLKFLNAHNQGCSNAVIPSGINFNHSMEDNVKVNSMEILHNLQMMTNKTATSDDDTSNHFACSIGITKMTNLQYGHNHSSRPANVESCLNTSNLVTFLKAQLILNQQKQAPSNSCNKQGSIDPMRISWLSLCTTINAKWWQRTTVAMAMNLLPDFPTPLDLLVTALLVLKTNTKTICTHINFLATNLMHKKVDTLFWQ